ncbi:hypothetical protein N7486_005043 [Penicillium sp. IBT 16267x]|nr:hypothetical protein N7486_005043 [Penicillium sp. IBT 16267x]
MALTTENSNHKAITLARSFSSLSTLCAAPDPPSNNDADMVKDSLKREMRWRLEEFHEKLLQEDKASIFLLREFGRVLDDFTDEFESHFPYRKDHVSNSKRWEVGLSQILENDPTVVATRLTDMSYKKFAEVPFGEYIRVAFGKSSDSIESFLWEYEFLCQKLYFNFIRAPNRLPALLRVKESLEKREADPFVTAAVEYAWRKVASLTTGEDPNGAESVQLAPRLQTLLRNLIVGPLQRRIAKAETARSILQDLKVLSVRFRHAYSPVVVDWDMPLRTSNGLLDHIRWMDIPALAEYITRKDKTLFSEYVVLAFNKDGNQARHILNTRWNRLMDEVRECMSARIGLASDIDLLAQHLHRHRNFFSFTAVVKGAEASDIGIVMVEKHSKLINDVEYYLHNMDTDGALHFLLPALFTLEKFKDTKYADKSNSYADIVIAASTSFVLPTHHPRPEIGSVPLAHAENVIAGSTSFVLPTHHPRPEMGSVPLGHAENVIAGSTSSVLPARRPSLEMRFIPLGLRGDVGGTLSSRDEQPQFLSFLSGLFTCFRH